MTIDASTPLVGVARAVCHALDRAGITAVLTGGSAATYHAPEAYQSSDIDFVAVRFGSVRSREMVNRHLQDIGFLPDRNCYRHPESPFPIEFPPGPLAVGRELITGWKTDSSDRGVLHVLSPTDCVKDRLAAYLHWNDRAGLAQALAVARSHRSELDLKNVEIWARGENGSAKFAEFIKRLENA